MKKYSIFLFLCILFVTLIGGCRSTLPSATIETVTSDSTFIKETEKVSDAIGVIDIRKESKSSAVLLSDSIPSKAINSKLSHLETEHAYSDAQIVNGILFHSINTKNESVQVIIPGGKVERTKEKANCKYTSRVVTKPVYVNHLKWWQKILMCQPLFLVAIYMFYVMYFRRR